MNHTTSLTLDELIETVSGTLRRMGLETLPDRRASLLPDTRMVRYYTTLGLLKAPRIVQRQAQYGPEHVEALLLVKLLQARGHSLARIQQELLGSSDSQRQAWLTQLTETAAQSAALTVAPPVSWQEYLLEPGFRIQLRSDYACTHLEATLLQVKALLEGATKIKQAKDGSPDQ
jgi:DNA-binding transcriptional MerR regulator